jgi:hemolysin D
MIGRILRFPNSKEIEEVRTVQHTLEFAPRLLYIQEQPPSPLPRMVLMGIVFLLFAMFLWAIFGRLDIVATAEGKLIPISYLKIVQPADSGIVREIVVTEGQHVNAGEVLVRMDAKLSEADSKSIQNDLQYKSLMLRRIEAELTGNDLKKQASDDAELFYRVRAEYLSNRRSLEDSLATERTNLQKARQDLSAALEIQSKLEQTLPTYKAQEDAYEKLGKVGFAGNLMVLEKQRERVEKEHDLRSLIHNVQSLHSGIAQSEKRLAQILSNYYQKLEADRVSIFAEHKQLEQQWAKQTHKNSLLELKAPQDGVVKDLATHTPGTVVSPGTVLMTLVPKNEDLLAEVWVKNSDAGFVQPGQEVKVKLSPYPFQKYGMVDGKVTQVSADASDMNHPQSSGLNNEQASSNQFAYRTLVKLSKQELQFNNHSLIFSSGMQVVAEIKLADQTIFEYLLSPIKKAFHEAGRER